MADSSGIDWKAFSQGLLSGAVGSQPVSWAMDAGVNVANLGKAAYGVAGHETGLLGTQDLPTPTDPATVPGTSSWIRNQIEANPQATEGLLGNIAGGFMGPGNVVSGARKLVGGATARAQPPRGEWWKGADGAPRFEINDQYAAMSGPLRPGTDTTLGKVLNHDDLYKHYPSLKYLRVKAMDPTEAAQTGKGGYLSNWGSHGQDPKNGVTTIFINPNLSPADQRSTLLHEIQHNLQHKEGFVPGASHSDMIDKAGPVSEWAQGVLKSGDAAGLARIRKIATELKIPVGVLTDPVKLGTTLYKRAGGEVESRAVQARAGMSKFERGQKPFQQSEDVAHLSWDDLKKHLFGSSLD